MDSLLEQKINKASTARMILAIVWLMLLSACGDGGSVTNLELLSPTFTPEQLSLPDNSVSLRQGQFLGDTITLEVWGENIAQPAYQTNFDIWFDQGMVRYLDFEPGDFFEQSASALDVEYTVTPPSPGRNRLNVRIVKSSTPLGSLEDGVFLKLRFQVTAAGASDVAIENPTLSGSAGVPAQGVQWIGGQLEAS